MLLFLGNRNLLFSSLGLDALGIVFVLVINILFYLFIGAAYRPTRLWQESHPLVAQAAHLSP